MPYHTLHDLPENVRSVLPEHGQEIYSSAFNHAWEEYKDPHKRHNPDEPLEEVCHKIAWSAVKKGGYTKSKEGHWIKT